jgi:F-type H+-transporting ATPase subunit delta
VSVHDLVGERYAKALIELASSNELVADSIANDLKFINDTVNENIDLKHSLTHPTYSSTQKRALLKEIFMGQVQELTLRLLDLLVNRRRLGLLPSIAHSYRNLLNAKHNTVTAQLISSEPLTESNLADIKARLNEYLGKNLSLETTIDPSLIAGFVLRIGDQVIDGSLKGRLNNIEKVLLSV